MDSDKNGFDYNERIPLVNIPDSKKASAQFTEITSGRIITKSYTKNENHISSGTFSVKVCDFPHSFANYLSSLDGEHFKAIVLGLPINGKAFQPFTTKKHETQDCIARTNDNLNFSHDALVVFDYDGGVLTHQEILSKLISIQPILKNAACVVVNSSSACILNTDTGNIEKQHRYHIYFAVKGDVESFFKDTVARVYAAGEGYIQLSKNFSLLQRNNLFDESVCQPSRVIYESGLTDLPSHLVQKRMEPVVIDGGCVVFSDEEKTTKAYKDRQSIYRAIADTLRQDKKPEAEREEELYLSTITNTKERKKRQNELGASRNSQLVGSLILYDSKASFDNKKGITVDTILSNPNKYHNTQWLDPFEPSYANYALKAKLYTDGSCPILVSQAHGASSYKLVHKEERMLKKCKMKFDEYDELPFNEAYNEAFNEIKEFIDSPYTLKKEARMLVLNGQTGLRKTSAIIDTIKTYKGELAIFVPTLKNAQEIKERALEANPKLNITIDFSPETDSTLCPRMKEFNDDIDENDRIKFSSDLCGFGEEKCKFFDSCPYQANRATQANVRIMSHQSIGTLNQRYQSWQPNIRVIDESLHNTLKRERAITRENLRKAVTERDTTLEQTKELEYIVNFFDQITALANKENNYSPSNNEITAFLENHRVDKDKAALKALRIAYDISLKTNHKEPIPKLTVKMGYSDIKRIQDLANERSSIPNATLQSLIDLLESDVPLSNAPFSVTQKKAQTEDGCISYMVLTHYSHGKISDKTSIPTLFLDATATKPMYKMFSTCFESFSRGYGDLEYKSIRYNANRTVIQVSDNKLNRGTIRKNTSYHRDRLDNFNTINGVKSLTSQSISADDELYLFNTRGRNTYESAKVLVMYGNTRVNLDAVKQLSLAFYGDNKDTRFPTFDFKSSDSSQQYLMRCGNEAGDGQKEYVYECELPQAISNYLIHSEFLQSIGRLRYSEEEHRYLILASNMPMPIYVDYFIKDSELTPDYLRNLTNDVNLPLEYLAIADHLANGDPLKVSYRSLMDIGISERNARQTASTFNIDMLNKAVAAYDIYSDVEVCYKARNTKPTYRLPAPSYVKVDFTAFLESLRQ